MWSHKRNVFCGSLSLSQKKRGEKTQLKKTWRFNREGSYEDEPTKYIHTTNTHSDSLLHTHSTIEDLEKFKENEVEWAGKTEIT